MDPQQSFIFHPPSNAFLLISMLTAFLAIYNLPVATAAGGEGLPKGLTKQYEKENERRRYIFQNEKKKESSAPCQYYGIDMNAVEDEIAKNFVFPHKTTLIESIAGPTHCEHPVVEGDILVLSYTTVDYNSCEVLDFTALEETVEYRFGGGSADGVEDVNVIDNIGWNKGLTNSCIGQTRRLIIPPSESPTSSKSGHITTVTIEDIVAPDRENGIRKLKDSGPKPKKISKGSHIRSPRTHKHKESNLKNTNHKLAKEGLRREKERRLNVEEQKRRKLSNEVKKELR